MKELSIEEKAKAYDEAVEKAKMSYHTGDYDKDALEMLEIIFPELKESEDERIRKWLIRYFKEVCDNVSEKEKKSVLDWLEKQGKQKPKFRVGDTIKCKYDDRQFTIKSVDLDKGTYTYTQEGCGNDIDYADKEFELVEQKPAWSEGDEETLGWLCTFLKEYGHEFYGGNEENVIDWLKSLKERVQAQPKQEWSEEDDCAIERLFCLLNNEQGNYSQLSSDFQEIEEIKNKLKSLKERYTWKPSDEQMHYLSWIANIKLGDSVVEQEVSKHLNELLEDLKKLREE